MSTTWFNIKAVQLVQSPYMSSEWLPEQENRNHFQKHNQPLGFAAEKYGFLLMETKFVRIN